MAEPPTEGKVYAQPQGKDRVVHPNRPIKTESPKLSRRQILTGAAVLVGAAVAGANLDNVGKGAQWLEKTLQNKPQKEARTALIEALGMDAEQARKKGVVYDLQVGTEGVNIRTAPAASDKENIIEKLRPGTIIPMAIAVYGRGATIAEREIWYAFPKPGDSRPLENVRIVFSYSGYFGKLEIRNSTPPTLL